MLLRILVHLEVRSQTLDFVAGYSILKDLVMTSVQPPVALRLET